MVDVVVVCESRLPIKMASDDSQREGCIRISAGAACDILRRAGSRLHKSASRIPADLGRAGMLHIDEATYGANGVLCWAWTIFSPHTEGACFAVRHGRGADVLRELPLGWNRAMACDEWPAYNGCKIRRCWAHILREHRSLPERNPDSGDTRRVLKWPRSICADAKRKRSAKAGQEAHDMFAARYLPKTHEHRRPTTAWFLAVCCEGQVNSTTPVSWGAFLTINNPNVSDFQCQLKQGTPYSLVKSH